MRFSFLALILPSLLITIPLAYAENIVLTNSHPVWYEYDCDESLPNSWTKSFPNQNKYKYFSYTDGTECHVILFTYDLSDLRNLDNVTNVSVGIDSRSLLLNDLDASDIFSIDCTLLNFDSGFDIDADSTFGVPTIYNSFSCTGTNSTQVQQITIPFDANQLDAFERNVEEFQVLDYTFAVLPDFPAAMRANLTASNYEYAIGKYANELDITGDGFNCAVISASNWCNFFNAPWEGVKKALGEDFIGDWFYVLVFFPLPMAVFLITRNGAYAGFVCLPIMLVIHTIDQVVFEISLSMILIASAFGFYEIVRKRLFE